MGMKVMALDFRRLGNVQVRNETRLAKAMLDALGGPKYGNPNQYDIIFVNDVHSNSDLGKISAFCISILCSWTMGQRRSSLLRKPQPITRSRGESSEKINPHQR
jgi:hypothetical protein